MKKLTTIILLFAMVLSMLVPVGAAEGAKLVMSGNNVANAQSVAAGAIGNVGAVGAGTTTTFRTEVDPANVDVWDGTQDSTFYDTLKNRDTTKENVYEITTAEQLYAWMQYRQYSRKDGANPDPTLLADVTLKLKVDLDLDNKTWGQINGDAWYAGKFDGEGHVITNFVTSYGSGGKGFLGCITSGAVVENFSVIGNVTVKRTNTSDETTVGGVFGNIEAAADTTTIVRNVYSAVNVSLAATGHKSANTKQMSSFAGAVQGTGTVKMINCKSVGTVSDADNTEGKFFEISGGLIAAVSKANVELANCAVASTINVGGPTVGGLIGYANTTGTVTIKNCEVTGTVQCRKSVASGSATTNIGGLIGNVGKSAKFTIDNCKVDAIVSNINATTQDIRVAAAMIGNLAALDTEITNCTVKGTVTATTRCAGIIAVPSAAGAIKVENCDVNVTLNARLGLAAGIYCNGNNQNGDVTVSNCKVAGKINASAATDSAYACAGVVCRFYTTNKAINVTVENCEVTMDIDAGKAKTGGVIGYLADTANDYNDIVVKNCSYNGTIDTQTETVGGIIGHIYGSLAGSLNVTNCNVAGSISGTSNIGGVIGRVGNTIAGDFNVKNCHVSADVNASGNTSGGVVGCIAKETNVSGLYTFANCSYTGNFVGKGFSNGGIIGYVETSGTPTNDYVFKNCVVGGTVTSNRSSGGFIGYIVCGNLLVEDCEVRGVINMTTGQAKNNKVGGVIGMMNVVNATLSDVVFSGTLNATIAPTKPGSDNPDCHVGGLIGYIARTSAVVRMDNCQVNAALCFAEAGDYAFLYNKSMAIFIGGGATSSSARPNVIYGQNVNYNLKALANATAHDVVLVGEGVPSMGNTAVLGYQIKWNKDETYDLRYIMGMKDVYDTVGVQAEIRYNFGEGVNVRYENVKVENVYKEVVDEKTNTYRAEDFAMDYLYTLTITGIPKEYAVHAGDLQVALIPYGISDGTTEFGVTTVQGDMGGFVELEDTDFGKTKPEAIDDALIHIYAGDYNVEETVKPATATASEVSGGKNVRHWYTNATTVLVYDFTVEEEGWYDAYFHLRLKNESVRSNQIVISNGETTETFTLFYVATSTHTALKDSTNGTYLSDVFEIYLTPGEYKMTILPGWTGGASSGSLHYRDIYFVK